MGSTGTESLVDQDSSREDTLLHEVDGDHAASVPQMLTDEEDATNTARAAKKEKYQAIQAGLEGAITMFYHADDVEDQVSMFRDLIEQLRLQMPWTTYKSTPFHPRKKYGKRKERETLLVEKERCNLTQAYLNQFQHEMAHVLQPIVQEIKELNAMWMRRSLDPHFRADFEFNAMVTGMKEVPPVCPGADYSRWSRNVAERSPNEVMRVNEVDPEGLYAVCVAQPKRRFTVNGMKYEKKKLSKEQRGSSSELSESQDEANRSKMNENKRRSIMAKKNKEGRGKDRLTADNHAAYQSIRNGFLAQKEMEEEGTTNINPELAKKRMTDEEAKPEDKKRWAEEMDLETQEKIVKMPETEPAKPWDLTGTEKAEEHQNTTPGAAGDLAETTAWKNEKNIKAELKHSHADEAEKKQNFRADRGYATKAKKKNVNKSATNQEENETQQSDNYEIVRHKKKKRNSTKAADQKDEEDKSQ